MRILFIVGALPFPPKQGIDLPLSRIIQALAQCSKVELLVISKSYADEKDFQAQLKTLPSYVHKVWNIRSSRRSPWLKIFNELFLIRPNFFIDNFSDAHIQKFWKDSGQCQYDWVWISPIGYLALLDRFKDLGIELTKRMALGYNDVVTTTYIDSLREVFSGQVGFNLQRLSQGLRTPWIWWHERRYLQTVDLVHVQTPLEVKRAKSILKGISKQPVILGAQNGRKKELENVQYCSHSPSKRVLFMTHLDGARERESSWFLQRVWPKVVQSHPEVELLLVGTPPQLDSDIARSLPPEAKVLGYVDDLVELYNSVSLAVVPIIHSTGLINRALDALTAGVPLVATPAVLSTIAGCQPGRDAIAASSASDFAKAICSLLHNPEQRQAYAKAGRTLSKKQPTWKDTTDSVVQALTSPEKKSFTTDKIFPQSWV